MLCLIIKALISVVDSLAEQKFRLSITDAENQLLTVLLRPAKVQLIIVTKAFKIVLFTSPVWDNLHEHFQENFFT